MKADPQLHHLNVVLFFVHSFQTEINSYNMICQ